MAPQNFPQTSDDEARVRIRRIFEYLKALNEYRSPAKRRIQDQPWHLWFSDLPAHPTIQLASHGEGEPATELTASETLITVRRPELTKAPPPPDAIREWLTVGWDDPVKPVGVQSSRNRSEASHASGTLERFEETPGRADQYERWRAVRDEWASNEVIARSAMRTFEVFYELYGRIQREGESYELVVGDGVLDWALPQGAVFHPVLLQPVQLEFEPEIPEFRILQTQRPQELYTGLLLNLPEVEGRVLASVREELQKGGYHPLGYEDTSGFLRALVARLAPSGEFVVDGKLKGSVAHPRIARAPSLFLRSRSQGFAALESALLALERTMPGIALRRIVGLEDAIALGDVGQSETLSSGALLDDATVLFSKPANEEQFRIAKSLEQHSCVLVQGPPGTGKSHTIANLIGHLLAQGETVLVTAHTNKALRVLREQVVEPLRPLCVSVLESDLSSRRELEGAVGAIVERLSGLNAGRAASEREELSRARLEALERVRAAESELLSARAGEYQDLVVSGQAFQPSDAAREVFKDRACAGWIPGPVSRAAPVPLLESEVHELYASNSTVSSGEELELQRELPHIAELLAPSEFDALCAERRQVSALPCDVRADLWLKPLARESLPMLEKVMEGLLAGAEMIAGGEPWMLAPGFAGYRGGDALTAWSDLLGLADELGIEATKCQSTLFEHGPELPPGMPAERAEQILDQILGHLESGGALTKTKLFFNQGWSEFIAAARVSTKAPVLPEHFRALQVLLNLERRRERLRGRWDRQIASLGAPTAGTLGADIERAAKQHIDRIRLSIDTGIHLKTRLADLFALGFNIEAFLAEQVPRAGANGELERVVDAVRGPLLEIVVSRANALKSHLCQERIHQLYGLLDGIRGKYPGQPSVDAFVVAAKAMDGAAYRAAHARLVRLGHVQMALTRRDELLRKLEVVAPGWASAIRHRAGAHGEAIVPGEVGKAWVWRQLSDELDRRSSRSLSQAQQILDSARERLRQVTAELIDRLAWERQAGRTSLAQRQALVGWLDTVRRIGKGTGKRAGQLRGEAQRLMKEAAGAVPVWIMPLSRVVENLDPATAKFDVVIIDEASQMDVLGLVAMSMGRKVVVVGDHEQVSPVAVGQDQDVVTKLIAEHLKDIPNNHLYDGRQSVYDLARQSFGGSIRLVEHFRCVPDIIHFSNWLSYDGAIRPLRETSHAVLHPHVVPHRISAGSTAGSVNKDEAIEVASLVVAAAEQSEYGGKTFGVISLVGEEQARFVDELLRKRMAAVDYEERRVVCGNAAQFQGDERDVMWLSVVDTPEEGPLRLRAEPMFKQRYNVAASRARDQMWVVYSLDPHRDLKAEDLRRLLIEYALDPMARIKQLERAEQHVESEFERLVLRKLMARSFAVRPQWHVGHYRIDLVVEGAGKRLAIECDGDRYHTMDNLREDLARQATLERLGWRFARIRGTEFFRDPDAAMAPVFEALERQGIPPELSSTSCDEPAPGKGGELRERVIRRASELRRLWASDVEEQVINRAAFAATTGRKKVVFTT
ncbi:MAG: AAA domain-containing protein [Pseudomonadota bacterium]